MKMWNVNIVVLLYQYFELASDKSTEIKTPFSPFLGLEPCNTDTTILFTFCRQENLGKLWYSIQMRFQ